MLISSIETVFSFERPGDLQRNSLTHFVLLNPRYILQSSEYNGKGYTGILSCIKCGSLKKISSFNSLEFSQPLHVMFEIRY
jgi:hypothetical protein